MKKINFLIIPMFFIAISCNKNDDDSKPGNAQTDKIQGKSFVVSYYYDKDKDETSDFAGYEFNFGTDGKLVATKSGGDTTTGTWAINNSDDDHDELVINLGTAEPLVELNDDWEIVEISETTIKLLDESGSGGIENLNFTKR